MEAVLIYHLPIRDKNTDDVKLWRLKEGSKVLEQLISAGVVERIPNSNTLKINSAIFLG